jgi:hypothetical protein
MQATGSREARRARGTGGPSGVPLWSWEAVDSGVPTISPPHPCHSREGGKPWSEILIYKNFSS